MTRTICLLIALFSLPLSLYAEAPLRVGIIGLDTGHVVAFTTVLNVKKPPQTAGATVVAAYPKGSPDIESSVSRVPDYTEKVKAMGVEIVDSIEQLLTKVDAVLLETNDGRPHLDQLRPCLAAKKPVFIDKPVAGTLSDAIKIYDEAAKAGVPVFSSSSLRFGKATQEVRAGKVGLVKTGSTFSPASLEKTHPDLFWYGIHGVESLFTIMGTGCQSVKRGISPEGTIQVTGTWGGGRIGTYTEKKGYGGLAIGEKGEAEAGKFDGYEPLLYEIIPFFRTGKSPVTPAETLEIYAFMEAADESKRQGGAEVTLDSVMQKARGK
ncbi:MAG: Gfo/Idh/MocA family oxidoreductase [Verrucomicrobiaceae bacterium]|nr:Gfo/Idh/MocA family oxidoreductase [Verrucomicrobiaceae bacterium]